jgi:LmbE family N-acetylglucosaminyl deacetylase
MSVMATPPSPEPRPGLLAQAVRMATLGWSGTPRGRRALRRGLRGLLRAPLRLRARTLAPHAVTSALVIAPHPDDEAFGCGGTVALLARAGAALHVAFVTDGSASHPNHPDIDPFSVATLRRKEARLAAEILGVDSDCLWFLDESDGTLSALETRQIRRSAAKLAGLLARTTPEAVLLPCRLDGSSEHEASFTLVSQAMRESGISPRLLEFPVWSWWNPLRLVPPLLTCRRVWRLDVSEVLTIKERAIAAYASQTAPLAPETTAALPDGFASFFLGQEEFLFER